MARFTNDIFCLPQLSLHAMSQICMPVTTHSGFKSFTSAGAPMVASPRDHPNSGGATPAQCNSTSLIAFVLLGSNVVVAARSGACW